MKKLIFYCIYCRCATTKAIHSWPTFLSDLIDHCCLSHRIFFTKHAFFL